MAAIFFLMRYILALTAFGGNMKQLELDNCLKKKRIPKNLSQKQLTRMIGTSQQTIIVIEKNSLTPAPN